MPRTSIAVAGATPRAGGWRHFEHLGAADRAVALGPDDLELLGRAAYLLGRDDEYVDSARARAREMGGR